MAQKMDGKEILQGTVERIVFQNNENGFTIFLLQQKTAPKDPITIKGCVPSLREGEHVQVMGAWINHPKFGRQFEAQQCTTQVPTSVRGLKKYLASGLIKGIGAVYADKLVDYFGEHVLSIIDQHPERLQEVPGIGPKRVDTIVKAWQDQKEISHIMVFLQEKNVSPTYATKIYKKYGNNSINVVLENPYRLADDIWGIGFKFADQLAQQMGFAHDSIKRITAGILYYLSTVTQQGHLYAEVEQLKKELVTLLELVPTQTASQATPTIPATIAAKIKTALHDLYNAEKICLVTHQEQHYIALARYYYAEKGVAHKIKKLMETPVERVFDIGAIYQELRTSHDRVSHDRDQDSDNKNLDNKNKEFKKNIELNEDQQRGILTCLQNKVTIITGGPGTGKTTLIKTLLGILDNQKQTYKLAAPTGRAAKRMQEGTGRYAETLHRLLEFDVSSMSFTKNEQNALKTDFLIVDEASMIDIFLAHALLKAIPYATHLILIGDIHQLPSVGAGNFLSDVIASQVTPCIKLSIIFRQAQNSLIIINAHRINSGEFPTSHAENANRDFIFIKEQEPTNVQAHIENIIKKGLPKFGIKPADMAVLVPMNRGTVGTQKINFDAQQLLNGGKQDQVMHAGIAFKVGDRVMQIRNNYDKHVFNGDTGTIEAVDTRDQLVHVRYPDKTVEYEFSELDELVLAYAISIHKSQGSEYPAVVIPLFMQHFMLLQRNLLYTAVTRAKKLCILIGQPKAIAMCISNNKGLARTTFLTAYLTSDLQCR